MVKITAMSISLKFDTHSVHRRICITKYVAHAKKAVTLGICPESEIKSWINFRKRNRKYLWKSSKRRGRISWFRIPPITFVKYFLAKIFLTKPKKPFTSILRPFSLEFSVMSSKYPLVTEVIVTKDVIQYNTVWIWKQVYELSGSSDFHRH